MKTVSVVFRKWKDVGTVIALFPELPSDLCGSYCDSYERIGQHGGADYHGVVQYTVPATRAEYGSLARELRRIGYRLRTVKRVSRCLHERRRKVARQYRTPSIGS
jgi:hypothetical protein